MNKHTPGPWWLDDLAPFPTDSGGQFWPVYCGEFEGPTEDRVADCYQSAADAHLIAAAPDLLAALVDCVGILTFIEPHIPGGYSPDGALARGLAAIAKARGGQP